MRIIQVADKILLASLFEREKRKEEVRVLISTGLQPDGQHWARPKPAAGLPSWFLTSLDVQGHPLPF